MIIAQTGLRLLAVTRAATRPSIQIKGHIFYRLSLGAGSLFERGNHLPGANVPITRFMKILRHRYHTSAPTTDRFARIIE